MPNTDWKEVIAAAEATDFARYGEQISEIQRRRAKGAAATRGFHPKVLQNARAQFTVLPGLPEHARQGLFAEPRTFEAWVRYSNGSIKAQDDHKGDVRGMVIKVLGVEGEKCISALGTATTQDFSMIQTPFLTFRDAAEFMWFVGASQQPLTLLPRMIGRFGFGRALWMLRGFSRHVLKSIPTLAAQQFWSPTAIA